MNAKNRYDGIIESIEEAVENWSDPAREIAGEEAGNLGLAPREFNAIMQFFTGSTAIDYIRKRKLMAAYKYLITDENPDIQTALSFTDYDNQSSFTTAFRKIFDMPPGGAMTLKDQSKWEEALTWDIITKKAQQTRTLSPHGADGTRSVQGVHNNNSNSARQATVLEERVPGYGGGNLAYDGEEIHFAHAGGSSFAYNSGSHSTYDDSGVSAHDEGGVGLIFGITIDQFSALTRALDLCSVYGFHQVYGNIAYNVSRELSISLEGAFEFVDSIFDYYDDLFIRNGVDEQNKPGEYGLPGKYLGLESLKRNDYFAPRIEMSATDPLTQYLYFDCDLSVSLGEQTIARMEFDLCWEPVELEDLEKYGPEFVTEFSTYEVLPYKYYRAAWNYYWDHAEADYCKDDFDEYMRMVCEDVPFADAFEAIYPVKQFVADVEADMNNPIAWIEDPILDEQFGAEEETFEAWTEEPDPGEDISGYDYDEENVYYED